MKKCQYVMTRNTLAGCRGHVVSNLHLSLFSNSKIKTTASVTPELCVWKIWEILNPWLLGTTVEYSHSSGGKKQHIEWITSCGDMLLFV